MEITYDPARNATNVELRGLSFERAAQFDFQTAVFTVDDRRDCGEIRYRAPGFLDGRLHALVFLETAKGIRVISFRKANKREVRRCQSPRPEGRGLGRRKPVASLIDQTERSSSRYVV
ncbi:BrnT family toxin [Rhodocyclus purpureus]|uniref:BrnT family toxin n=1 Tax=Rhodocyclus purpureus TaxID=1067 RepID=UPI0019139816|nr:BrnT family toxin [Rhodocyclus purpureus]MBK5912741.1 hypothetical protein [Rhodocyclus purpureus]